MTFQEQLTADCAIFTSVAEFGETISYTQRGETAIDVPALVDRAGLSRRDTDGGRTLTHPVVVSFDRALVTTITVGGDFVTLKKQLTDSSTTRMRVAQVVLDDPQWVVLGLQ
jgi:hypothetical protein